MKKTFLICLIVLFSFSLSLAVLAQEGIDQATEEPVEVSILPDSPLYWLKILGEKIQETFTLRSEKKLQLMEKLGEKRAAEAEKLIDKGKPALAEKIMDKYNQRLEKMKSHIEKKGEKLETKLNEAQIRIQNRFEKRNQVLERVMEKAPEQARPGLQRALQNSEQRLQGLNEAIQKRIEIREQRNQRLQQQTGNTDNLNADNTNTAK